MSGVPGTREGTVRVLMVDGMLPDVDGVEVLRRLRGENERLRGLLRRAGPAQTSDQGPVRTLGDLVLAESTREVQRGAPASGVRSRPRWRSTAKRSPSATRR
ncbi:hypothetical protein [Streptomyces sp. 3214.6]|uniref:hypothetical protein n=1 Tax=Streptomyces sp. 3214.6 TaxID=1882757 RepID=UPI00090B08D5|nr:hypothetical protein SAMN05444521_7862 [Streptomyces sp. 3214.6]